MPNPAHSNGTEAFVSVFLTDDDKLFLPTARHIWDVLQTTDPVIR